LSTDNIHLQFVYRELTYWIMLTLGTFMTIAKVVENVGYIFPTLKVVSICVNFGKTRVGLYFGRFFTLTHLVTLVDSYIPNCISGNIYICVFACI
jgi:hypothetical protein